MRREKRQLPSPIESLLVVEAVEMVCRGWGERERGRCMIEQGKSSGGEMGIEAVDGLKGG